MKQRRVVEISLDEIQDVGFIARIFCVNIFKCALQRNMKQIKRNTELKKPSWQEANQLAIYKTWWS